MIINNRKLVESLLALAGIWLLARQIPDYATVIFLILSGELPEVTTGPSVLGLQTIHFAVSVAAGVLLLLLRGRIAEWIHPSETSSEASAGPILAAGIVLLAIYFVISGILDLGLRFSNRYDVYQTQWFIQGGLSVLLGSLLFVGTKRICLLFERIHGRTEGGA